ncbi:hypothetical protein C8Q79DRAFT_137839 [Trametes meyenii]|nr:hypothetical protein C8Q79DRAFT_137839 [Trametes meyenii]
MGSGLKPRSTRQDIVSSGLARATKDAEVARLREELQQCNMKLAHFQASLIGTLDELDAQRDAHRREMKVERSAKDKLSKKLDLYLEDVKRAEKERDDMREVVSILLEKVERSSDYSAWPCPRMALACPLELLSDREEPDTLNTGGNSKDTSHIAMVGLLQNELAHERHARIRTKEEADAEILRLKAMIARRDAELEACATHSGHRVLLSSLISGGAVLPRACTRSSCPHGREHSAMIPSTLCNCRADVPESEAVIPGTVLPQTVSRNRALEREVELLRRNVEEVRNTIPPRVDKPNAAAGKPLTPGYASVGVQVSMPIHLGDDDNHLPPSPGLLPVTIPSSPTPFMLTPGYEAMRVRDEDLTLLAQGAAFQSDSAPNTAVHGLGQDIDRLAIEIDGFVIARKQLKEMVLSGLPQDAPGFALHHSATSDAPVHLDNECTRAQQELREQLNAITRERARREQELEAEITSLRQALLDLGHHQPALPPPLQEDEGGTRTRYSASQGDLKVPPVPSPRVSPTLLPGDARALEAGKTDENRVVEGHAGQATSHTDQRFNGRTPPERTDGPDELGEQSMELATPLQTTILSLREEDWPLPPADIPKGIVAPQTNLEPAEVPLPLSPDCEPVPAAPLISPPHRPATPHSSVATISPPLTVAPSHASSDLLARLESATEARVSSLEHELAATQRELEEREAALANLQTTAAYDNFNPHPLGPPPSHAPDTGSDAA